MRRVASELLVDQIFSDVPNYNVRHLSEQTQGEPPPWQAESGVTSRSALGRSANDDVVLARLLPAPLRGVSTAAIRAAGAIQSGGDRNILVAARSDTQCTR